MFHAIDFLFIQLLKKDNFLWKERREEKVRDGIWLGGRSLRGQLRRGGRGSNWEFKASQ